MGSPHCTEMPWIGSHEARHATPRRMVGAHPPRGAPRGAVDGRRRKTTSFRFSPPLAMSRRALPGSSITPLVQGRSASPAPMTRAGVTARSRCRLGARQTRHFNSGDLERGNAAKGLSGGLGEGEGYWRLSLESDLDLEVGAYIRTADGFLSSVHDVVPTVEVGGETVHRVSVFNPGSNRNQVSWLRLVNLTRAGSG